MDKMSTLISNRLDEGRTSFRVCEVVHTIKAVCGTMRFRNCSFFDLKYALEDDFIEYIMLNKGIELIFEELDYHENSFGSVFKRTVYIKGKGHHRYTISIPPSVVNLGDRIFTLGHELGHILLHGRLLIADLKAPKTASSWFNPMVRMPLFMELEANIFSLHYMMPRSDILDIYARERSWSNRVDACKEMMMAKYGDDLPSGIAESRLLAHDLGNDPDYKDYLCKSSYSEIFDNGIEWLVFGQAKRIREARQYDELESISASM